MRGENGESLACQKVRKGSDRETYVKDGERKRKNDGEKGRKKEQREREREREERVSPVHPIAATSIVSAHPLRVIGEGERGSEGAGAGVVFK